METNLVSCLDCCHCEDWVSEVVGCQVCQSFKPITSAYLFLKPPGNSIDGIRNLTECQILEPRLKIGV